MGINVLQVDSWRVRNVFISDNGVSYEVLSHPMYTLTDQPRLYSRISFEHYIQPLKSVSVEWTQTLRSVWLMGSHHSEEGVFHPSSLENWENHIARYQLNVSKY